MNTVYIYVHVDAQLLHCWTPSGYKDVLLHILLTEHLSIIKKGKLWNLSNLQIIQEIFTNFSRMYIFSHYILQMSYFLWWKIPVTFLHRLFTRNHQTIWNKTKTNSNPTSLRLKMTMVKRNFICNFFWGKK